MTIPREDRINIRTGLTVHRSPLPTEDVLLRGGLGTTTIPRTLTASRPTSP